MSDGGVRAWVGNLTAAVNGNGATRTISLSLAGIGTGAFNVGAGPTNPGLIGWIGCSGYVAGGSGRFQINTGASIHFAHAGAGTNVHDGHGTSWSGALYAGYQWFQGPSAPGLAIASSSDGTQATATVTAPGDNGGLAVSGYYIQRADDAGFTTNVVQLGTSGAPVIFTAMTPGKTYYWRACARNLATDVGGLGGQWSTTQAVTQNASGIGLILAPSGWVPADGMILTPSGWVPAAAKILTSSGWVDV
jgi:hypothetical protein